jgi:hypothetical protein
MAGRWICGNPDGNLVICGRFNTGGGNIQGLLMQASPQADLLDAMSYGGEDIGLFFSATSVLPDQRVVFIGKTTGGINGAWQDRVFNATTITGSWSSVVLATTILDTTTGIPDDSIVEINTGLIDEAAGANDCVFGAQILY